MNYSLIIPIFNEERTLPILIDKLSNIKSESIEIIIIDDGSNDETKTILNRENGFIVIRNNINLGKGASIKKGIEYASNKNIILIDGDLEIDLTDIKKLIIKYEHNNSDVLAGVRWIKNNYDQSYDINTIGNFIINFLFNTLYRTSFNDVLCCVKILSLKNFNSLNIQSQGFSIEIETMCKLVLNGFTIEEELVKYSRRTIAEGKKLKFSDSWNIIWTMLKLRLISN